MTAEDTTPLSAAQVDAVLPTLEGWTRSEALIPPNYVVAAIPAHRKPSEVRICRLSIQSGVGMRPPSTSTPHVPALRARRW